MLIKNEHQYSMSEVMDILRVHYPGYKVWKESRHILPGAEADEEAFDANVYLQLGDAQVEISPHQEGGLEIKAVRTAANKNQNLALGICAVVFATAKVLLEHFTDFSFRFFSLQGLIFSILFVVCVKGLAHLLNDGMSSSSSYYAHVAKSVAEVLSKGRA